MFYNGVAYPYAFEFNEVPVRDERRTFRIVISEYRETTEDFSGLCLENELKVTSGERLRDRAFIEIVKKIVTFTREAEQFYMDNNNGEEPKPMLSVTDKAILDLFEERKKSHKSLKYYEKLKPYAERPESMLSENLPTEKQLDIYDRTFMILLFKRIKDRSSGFFKFSKFCFFRT